MVLDMRLKVLIGLGTFIMSLFTLIMPTIAIPDCPSIVGPDMDSIPAIMAFGSSVRPSPLSLFVLCA